MTMLIINNNSHAFGVQGSLPFEATPLVLIAKEKNLSNAFQKVLKTYCWLSS